MNQIDKEVMSEKNIDKSGSDVDINGSFDPKKSHLYPEAYTTPISNDQLKELIPDIKEYDIFNPSEFSAKNIDLSEYIVSFFFDNMEYYLGECISDENPFDPKKVRFASSHNETDVFRYWKTKFPNRDMFIREVLDGPTLPLDECPDDTISSFIKNELKAHVLFGYDNSKAFSYAEAFELTDTTLRALVFDSINITEMIESLGHERISVKGIPVKRKIYSNTGEFMGYKEYDNIYEVHKVDGSKMNIEEPLYAVKCWCTSTNKEHWIWIEKEYANDPLVAIASTFRIHENIIPHIKELKRQGDIMIVEMNNNLEPKGKLLPLTPDQYFGLLTAES